MLDSFFMGYALFALRRAEARCRFAPLLVNNFFMLSNFEHCQPSILEM